MPKTKILIAIDDPDWASIIVQTLFNLISKENSEIILLNVLETTLAEENYFYKSPKKFIKHEARKANFAYVENLLEKNQFDYQFIFKEGDAAEIIINMSKKLGVDLVVVGTHNKKIFETFFLGSVSYKVSRLSKCSVMIVSSKYHIHNVREKEVNILFAVDGSDFSKKAAKRLPELIDVKRTKINILNVTVPPQKVIPAEAYIYTDISRIIEEARQVSNELIDNIAEIIKKYNPTEIKKTSLIGEPAEKIVDFAEKNAIDLIVMGTHGKKDLSSFFLGSISTKVSEKSEIPLLLIKKNIEK